MLAIISLLEAIVKVYQISKASVDIFCDNQEALRHKPLDRLSYSKMTQRDIDTKLEIQQLIKTSLISYTFKSVPGHQDDKEDFDYSRTPHSMQRNIDMDKKASKFFQNPP